MKFNEDNLVIKSNKIIEAKYRLNAIEQKIILFLVSMIKKDDKDFNIWKIKISELANFLGINSKYAYKELKKATYNMLDKKLRLKSPGRELQLNWLSSAEYLNKEGYVELEISKKLKVFLLQLKDNFTKYTLKQVISLKSIYSIRIYELLKQYEKIGERYIEIQELKEMLGTSDKYNLYKDFKKRTILRAQKELKEKTDLSFKFTEKKKTRKVIGINFFIKKNNPNKEECRRADITSDDTELSNRLRKYFCLSPKDIKEVLEKYTKEYILEKAEYVENVNRLNLSIEEHSIKNIRAYLLACLKDDWNIGKSQFNIDEKNKQIKKKKDQLEIKLKEDYEIYKRKKLKEFENILNNSEKDKLKKQVNLNKKDLSINIKRLLETVEYNKALNREAIKKGKILEFKKWKKQFIV